jgi:hypothetical protein
MGITFDPINKRIIQDTYNVSATEIWSRYIDWIAQSDNSKYPLALRQVGGDELGGGLFIPIYIFLLDGWRIRPMEQNHTLIITGNIFVEGGGIPVVQTLGDYNVSTQYTVPVQAQGISTSGSSVSVPSTTEIADAVWNHNSGVNIAIKLAEAWGRLGLDPSKPLVTGQTSITFGDIVMAMSENTVNGTVTLNRL